jgi:hypothetical protein
VPTPKLGTHPPDAYVEVPYPPPAAAAEIVSAQPNAGAVWVDGQWSWRGRYYVWQRGGWVMPPRGAQFARWNRFYGKDGTLYFAEGTWRTSRGQRLPPPPVLRPAGSPPEPEVPEAIATH